VRVIVSVLYAATDFRTRKCVAHVTSAWNTVTGASNVFVDLASNTGGCVASRSVFPKLLSELEDVGYDGGKVDKLVPECAVVLVVKGMTCGYGPWSSCFL